MKKYLWRGIVGFVVLALVIIVVSPQLVGATADISFLQSATNTTSATSFTFSSQNLGVAASDRHIVVSVVAKKSGVTGSAPTVTVAGVTATQVVGQVSGLDLNRLVVYIYIAAVPTGTSGDVVVDFSPDTYLRTGIGMWRATNISSSAAHDTLNVGWDSGGGTPISGTIDVPDGGFIIGASSANEGTTADPDNSVTWTGITEDFDSAFAAFGIHTGAHDLFESGETGRTITADYTSDNGAIMAIASWAPAPPDDVLVRINNGTIRINNGTLRIR